MTLLGEEKFVGKDESVTVAGDDALMLFRQGPDDQIFDVEFKAGGAVNIDQEPKGAVVIAMVLTWLITHPKGEALLKAVLDGFRAYTSELEATDETKDG